MADQAHVNQTRIFDANGDPVPGALVNIYASGTLARIDIWLDQGETTLATNPIVADANGGIPQIFVRSAANVVVTTATGATLYALDPAPIAPTAGSAASQVSFAPSAGLPFTNAQDAIIGSDVALRILIAAGGTGVTGDAQLLSALDATTAAGGVYRFAATTTGTFPAGVAAADTGLVCITRQSATQAVMEMFALGRYFRRLMATTWGAWVEVIETTLTRTEGQLLRVKAGATGLEYGSSWTNSATQALSGGTSFDFAIPAWAKSVKLMLFDVSLSGIDNILIRLGTGSGVETTGYQSSTLLYDGSATSGFSASTAFTISTNGAAARCDGMLDFALLDVTANVWAASGSYSRTANAGGIVSGAKSLAAALTTIRITRSGTNTFDAGSASVMYS